MLIDRKMKKKDFMKAAGLSPHNMLTLRKNRHITTKIIEKICNTMDCKIDDFMEIIYTQQ